MKSNFDNHQNQAASDQMKGLAAPSLQKAPKQDAQIINLPNEAVPGPKDVNLYHALNSRRSIRKFSDVTMSLAELAYLLETTCRIQKVIGDNIASFRPAPSGGARHAFETYLVINNVDGLENGTYHYLPLYHQLEKLTQTVEMAQIIESVNGQSFVESAHVIFYFSAVPYRAEWRYGLRSHKVMLIDLGHLGQNLYLAAEGIRAGACAIASYDQEKADALFKLDGIDEFIVYIIPVGKKL